MGKCENCGKYCKGKYRYCSDCYSDFYIGDSYFSKKPVYKDDDYVCIDVSFDPEYKIILLTSEFQCITFSNEDDYVNSNKEVRDKHEANYRAEDGHKVRSTHEMIIDNYLFNHNIRHVYEKIVYSMNSNDKCTCDWYLPDYDVYIEYWGLDGKRYNEEKIYKLNIYKENELKLLEIEKDDLFNKLNDKITEFISKQKKVRL